MHKVVIIGAGGHGRVCAEAAAAAGFAVRAFCDAAGGADIGGLEVLKAATLAEAAVRFAPEETGLVIAIGDNDARMQRLAEADALGYALPAIIHPSAVISPSAEIGTGTVIIANSVVNANARIGNGCILNTACSVDHDNVLADGVQICPGVRAAGNVHFGEKSFVGTGAVIVPGIRIGREAHIAAGALVIRDVGDGERIGRAASRPQRD